MAARHYFDGLGYEMSLEINPTEYLLDLINTEIVREGDDVNARIEHIHAAWDKSPEAQIIKNDIEIAVSHAKISRCAIPILLSPDFRRRLLAEEPDVVSWWKDGIGITRQMTVLGFFAWGGNFFAWRGSRFIDGKADGFLVVVG